ncbi:MAG TPA: hypothetical protein VK929_02260 [Longimicrobiales bacterium]|nr:hypothetical protein [Longimicrobiales bacterium]
MNGILNHYRPRRAVATAAVLLLAATLYGGCATTGATWGSGVGDTYFTAPPYVAGARPVAGSSIAHTPVTYQRGATLPGTFDLDPARSPALAALLHAMNSHLDGLGSSLPVRVQPRRGTAPDVMFGCERAPDDECADSDPRLPHRLAVGRPSASWVAWADSAAATVEADYLLVITLEVGNYLPRQRNLRGDKEILLGTGHTADVRWLTALDRPASVLQLTGVLVEPGGQARRIAAEGLAAHPTHVVLAGLGGQALISETDLERLLHARRTDLEGTPPVWQVALQNLVGALTGGDVVVRD